MDTLFTGRTIIDLHEVESTNTYAMEALRSQSLTEGTVVRAAHQTGGRGQYGNKWQSEAGKNLTFSLVMHPVFLSAGRQFYLSKVASLAVFGVLTEVLPASQYDIRIKWPNDVLVNGDKIAGILIENVLGREGRLEHSVTGVGLNVNQASFGELKRSAISLAMLLGRELSGDALLARFCKHFEALYLGLKQGREAMLDRQYLLNLHGYGRELLYRAGGKEFYGRIKGVTPAGRLLLAAAGGEELEFEFKEIEFLE